MPKSFLNCPHNNVQEYTECCLDCGYNRYISKEEYLLDLQKQIEQRDRRVWEEDPVVKEIRKAEKTLGVGKRDDEEYGSNW